MSIVPQVVSTISVVLDQPLDQRKNHGFVAIVINSLLPTLVY